MNIGTTSERMVVISDLHIGNPFCDISKDLIDFMAQVCEEGYDLCINGDGFDVMQTSVEAILDELPAFANMVSRFSRKGLTVYYVVGNHDITLENLILSIQGVRFCPFINLDSGQKRIRIEHGYLYDPAFIKNPVMYERLVHLAGFILKIAPPAYKLWIKFEKFKNKKKGSEHGLRGEPETFFEASKAIHERGFDAVVFGHTHHSGEVNAEVDGVKVNYFNTGSFMLSPDYLVIEHGNLRLRRWERGESI
ncbi:MAG: metallophosphoesterase [Pontibacterium sp.]